MKRGNSCDILCIIAVAEVTVGMAENWRENSCEDCEFYDYDESDDSYGCRMSLDEDEYGEMLSAGNGRCRYYRPYDEYRTVRKQI